MAGSRQLVPVLTPEERFMKLEGAGTEFRMDRNIPIRRYYNSGAEILRTANNYFEDDSLEKAYLLYHRYLSLFIEKVDKHPEFHTVPARDKAKVKANLLQVFKKCEKIKAVLKEVYKQEYAAYLDQLEEQRAEEEELARRLEAMKTEQDEQRKWQETEDFRRAKENSVAEARDRELAIWHQCQLNEEMALEEMKSRQQADTTPAQPSAPPPPPEVPPPPSYDRTFKPAAPSVPDRSTKPPLSGLGDLGILGGGGGRNDGGLRPLIVPETLMPSFLSLAEPNTTVNVETCGFLAGRITRGRLVVTHLVIPRQSGTADSCATESEEDFLAFLDDNNLITLGWIHTHPSQTAFLSSVDLHTHMPYQLMLPEAVAIVCAPKYNETGFFVLTPNYGLDYIANCTLGGFHPHPKEPPLFEEGSHITLDKQVAVKVVDLR